MGQSRRVKPPRARKRPAASGAKKRASATPKKPAPTHAAQKKAARRSKTTPGEAAKGPAITPLEALVAVAFAEACSPRAVAEGNAIRAAEAELWAADTPTPEPAAQPDVFDAIGGASDSAVKMTGDSGSFIASACEDDAFDPSWPRDEFEIVEPVVEQTAIESPPIAATPPLPPPLRAVPRKPDWTPAPRNLDYLARARGAANAHAEAQRAQRPPWLERPVTIGVAAAIAAPLLLGTALMLTMSDEGAQAHAEAVALRTPEASTPPLQQGEALYDAALRSFNIGDAARGVADLRASADAGFPRAQYRLAKLLERGQGVPRDLAAARLWVLRAAGAGNCRAMHDAGVFLARGDGGPLDAEAAFRWFHAAAECGVADSQYNLGILYTQGRGVAADPKAALFWFLVAAHTNAGRDASAFDQALDLATEMTPADVEDARARARMFQPHAPDPFANGDDR